MKKTTSGLIVMELGARLQHWPRKNPFHFGAYPNHAQMVDNIEAFGLGGGLSSLNALVLLLFHLECS